MRKLVSVVLRPYIRKDYQCHRGQKCRFVTLAVSWLWKHHSYQDAEWKLCTANELSMKDHFFARDMM